MVLPSQRTLQSQGHLRERRGTDWGRQREKGRENDREGELVMEKRWAM